MYRVNPTHLYLYLSLTRGIPEGSFPSSLRYVYYAVQM